MTLDRLLEPEPEYPRDDWSRGRNQLRESVRPEVEALLARVAELEKLLIELAPTVAYAMAHTWTPEMITAARNELRRHGNGA